MATFDPEIDCEQDELVRKSLVRLQPGVSFEEWHCVERLARRQGKLRHLFEFSRPPGIEIWDLEQLDRRGWIEAQEVDLQPEDARETGLYKGRGPAFRPLFNGRRDGRPDWPSIHTSIAWASDKPTAWYNRRNACIRLTGMGRRVAEVMAMNDLPELGVFDRTAYALQRISAGWRGRDQIASRWLAVGVSTAQTHYEFEIRDRAMHSVAVAVSILQHELIPQLALHIDPSLRDELRMLVRALDPFGEEPDATEGYPTERWRQSWGEIGRDREINALASILWAMQPRDPESSAEPESEPSTDARQSSLVTPAFRPGIWFDRATKGGLTAATLKTAKQRETLTESKKASDAKHARWLHQVPEVCRKYPQFAALIGLALSHESSAA